MASEQEPHDSKPSSSTGITLSRQSSLSSLPVTESEWPGVDFSVRRYAAQGASTPSDSTGVQELHDSKPSSSTGITLSRQSSLSSLPVTECEWPELEVPVRRYATQGESKPSSSPGLQELHDSTPSSSTGITLSRQSSLSSLPVTECEWPGVDFSV